MYDRITENLLKDIETIDENDDNPSDLLTMVINKHAMYLFQSMPPARVNDDDLLLSLMRDANKIGAPHVSEVYSPPRVTSLAKRFGVRPGCALDLTVIDDHDGLPWDFNVAHKRERAMQLVQKTNPAFLILSPMCRMFSTLQNLNRARMGEKKFQELLRRARVHLAFSMELAK